MKSTLAILSVCLMLFRTGECVITFTLPAGGNQSINLNSADTTIATLGSTGGSGTLTYAITAQTTADTFEIVSGATATGEITLKSPSTLSTTIPVHLLTVSVADSTSPTALTATGKLYITVNTATPAFSDTGICTEIASTLTIDSIIGIYKATDADAGTTLTYALSAASTLVDLNSATGVLTAKVAFTSSTPATSTVIVYAKDTGSSNTGTTTVTILRGGTCDSGATVLSAAVMTTAGALAMLHFF